MSNQTTTEHAINVVAILALREGYTGPVLAQQILHRADVAAARYLSGDDRESAKTARLQYQLGALEGEIRRLADMLAQAVEPTDAEQPESAESLSDFYADRAMDARRDERRAA